MKNWIYLAFVILTFNCKGQEKNCSDFKTGKFNYVMENRPELIIRTDTTQIEINPITKVEIYSSVQWTSDCEYTMTYEKILNHPEDVSHMIGQKLHVEIISTDSQSYKVRATSPRLDHILEFKIADGN